MKINALVIDTDYTRALLRKKLAEQDHKVIAESKSYSEGLELYADFLPDVVILDIDLESQNKGILFIEELLKLDPTAQIIALSNFFDNRTKARLFHLGVERLVAKPYQPAHIWEKIDDICNQSNILKMREQRASTVDASRLSNSPNKGEVLNNQILSIREQISRNRNTTDNKSNDIKSLNIRDNLESNFSGEQPIEEIYFEDIDNLEFNDSIDIYNEEPNTSLDMFDSKYNLEVNTTIKEQTQDNSWNNYSTTNTLSDYYNPSTDDTKDSLIEDEINAYEETFSEESNFYYKSDEDLDYYKTSKSNNSDIQHVSFNDTYASDSDSYEEYTYSELSNTDYTEHLDEDKKALKGYLNLPVFLNRDNSLSDNHEVYSEEVEHETDNNSSTIFNRLFKKK